jgi:hypothetical protein
MRISRKRNFRSWTRETSRLGHNAKAEKRMRNPPDIIDRPVSGMLLKTIRVTDEICGKSFEIKIHQSDRLNQVTAETFGRRSRPMGVDLIMRRLRERCVVRWLQL